MKIKRLICALICVCLILVGCGDNSQGGGKDKTDGKDESLSKNISLLCSYADSFNPYTALSPDNRRLCNLLFEPLIKTDNNFEVVMRLADSVQAGDKTFTVTLKSAVFSDGTAVTADDVVYSFGVAKTSSTSYSQKLYEVTSVAATSQNTVVFNLTRNDPYIANLLDFPIIKKDSDKLVDSDGIAYPPIGCGRYILSADKTSLLQNDRFYGNKGDITKIELINAPDSDAISHYVEVGAVGIYYADLADGNIVRMSGKREEVNLNNFVYIGINSSYGDLSGKYMRYAISSAIDRTAVCSEAYYNTATPATGFFNPHFSAANSVQSILDKANLQITIENLNKIGYNREDGQVYCTNIYGKHPVYTLLVNSENHSRVLAAQLIARQLENAGIEIKVIQRSYAEYLQLISTGNFQLYLGEINILPNMDLSQLVIPGGSAAYGVGLEPIENTEDSQAQEEIVYPCKAVVDGFYAGSNSISDVAGTLLTEMPQIPICYRQGLLFYDSVIKDGVTVSESDIYFSIESYILK